MMLYIVTINTNNKLNYFGTCSLYLHKHILYTFSNFTLSSTGWKSFHFSKKNALSIDTQVYLWNVQHDTKNWTITYFKLFTSLLYPIFTTRL